MRVRSCLIPCATMLLGLPSGLVLAQEPEKERPRHYQHPPSGREKAADHSRHAGHSPERSREERLEVKGSHVGLLAAGGNAATKTSTPLDPLLLLICLHRGSSTYKAIAEAGRFGLSILNNSHKDVAMLFASRTADKFGSDVVVRAEDGTAFIDGALVQMHCELVETFQGGTHALFMAKPTSITVRDEAPLLYFQGQLGIEA